MVQLPYVQPILQCFCCSSSTVGEAIEFRIIRQGAYFYPFSPYCHHNTLTCLKLNRYSKVINNITECSNLNLMNFKSRNGSNSMWSMFMSLIQAIYTSSKTAEVCWVLRYSTFPNKTVVMCSFSAMMCL